MSTILGNAYVRVRPDMDGFDADVKRSVGSAMKSAAKIAAVAVVGAAAFKGAQVLKDSVRASSDLNESLNAVNVTFGKSAAGIIKLGESASKSLGLSQKDFNSLAVQFSNFATTVAGDGGDVTKVMADLTGRAADFASVMNLDVAEAATLFQSGLAGETEPLRRYGIDLSAAAVEAYALANGIGDGSGELTEQEKILARYGLIMASTSQTQGDFANTSDSLANQTRILKSTFEDAKAAIGAAFTPLAESLLPKVTELVSGMTADLKENMPTIQAAMADFGTDIGAFIDKMGGWPGIQAELEKTTALLKEDWPEIKETVSSLAESLGTLAGAVTTLTGAFKELPPELQQVIVQLAILSRFFKGPLTFVAFVGLEWINNALKPLLTGEKSYTELLTERLGISVPLLRPVGIVWDAVAESGFMDRLRVVGQILEVAFGQMRDSVTRIVGQMFTNIHNFFQGIGRSIETAVSTAWNVVTTNFQMMKDDASRIFSGMVANIGAIWTGVTDVVKAPIREMFKWINENMIRPINSVLGKFSASVTLGELPKFADGGLIQGPGTGRSDSILARVSNGEYVMPAAATAKNKPVLDAMRSGAVIRQAQDAAQQGYGIGGPLDWITDVLAKGAAAAVRFFANPALDLMQRMFGGEWAPDLVIAGMRNVVANVMDWATKRDSETAGGWDGPPVNIGDLVKPLPRYVVTSEWMRSGSDPRHFGIDLGAPTGTPVYSIAAGKVIPMTSANVGATGGYGIMATVDHGGLKSLYAHMSQLAVTVGEQVKKGQLLGRVGSTGQSTGPHLHFETHKPGFGPVNPRSVMAFDSGGYLQPGWTTVFNGTGKPEPVFTDAQWQQMTKAKEGATYNVQISPVTPASPDEVAAALRRVDLLYGVV